MIRINLLSEGRRPVVARKQKPKLGLGDVDPSNLILGAGLVVGILATGSWWWMLNSNLNEVKDKVRVAQAEVEELEPIIKEVEQFKKKKGDLEKKVEVIEALKAKQAGPVRKLDLVSRALPELLWLNSMQMNGDGVNLRGNAFNVNAISTFIKNLDDLEEFQEPKLKSMQQRGQTYNFSLDLRYLPPKTEEESEDDEDA